MDFNTYPSGPRAQCCVCKAPASVPDTFCGNKSIRNLGSFVLLIVLQNQAAPFPYEREKKL